MRWLAQARCPPDAASAKIPSDPMPLSHLHGMRPLRCHPCHPRAHLYPSEFPRTGTLSTTYWHGEHVREQPLGQEAPCQRPRPSRIAVSDSTTCSFKSATSAFSPVADKLSEPLGAQPKAAPAAANAAAVAPLRKKLRRLTLVLLFDDIDPPPIRTLTFPAKHLRANDLLSLAAAAS